MNGNGKTTLLRDVIAGTDTADKPKSNITIESNGKVETFSLPDASGNKAYKGAFSKVIFYKAEDYKDLINPVEDSSSDFIEFGLTGNPLEQTA